MQVSKNRKVFVLSPIISRRKSVNHLLLDICYCRYDSVRFIVNPIVCRKNLIFISTRVETTSQTMCFVVLFLVAARNFYEFEANGILCFKITQSFWRLGLGKYIAKQGMTCEAKMFAIVLQRKTFRWLFVRQTVKFDLKTLAVSKLSSS